MIFLKTIFIFLLLSFGFNSKAQNASFDSTYLTVFDFINIVKLHHPIASQAKLIYSSGQAALLSSRGGFDPILYGEYEKKQFNNKGYWQKLDAGIKIPTWYGLEGKLSYEYNEGERSPDGSFIYMDNERVRLASGLAFAGFTFTPSAGLWMDERRATLLKAKQFLIQSNFDQALALNDLYFDALGDYFDWAEKNMQYIAIDSLYNASNLRFKNSINLAKLGDIPFNDTLDAFAQFAFFSAMRADFLGELVKATFKLSNHLWLNGNPIRLDMKVRPPDMISNLFSLDSMLSQEQFFISNHPKILAIYAKIESQKIDLSLNRNKLLPKIDLTAGTYLSNIGNNPLLATGLNANHKLGVDFKMPLMMREQRGQLELNRIKLETISLEQKQTALEIANKSKGLRQAILLNQEQVDFFQKATNAYKQLVINERYLFTLGETDFFKINLREQKLIESELKLIKAKVNQLKLESEFAKNLGLLVF